MPSTIEVKRYDVIDLPGVLEKTDGGYKADPVVTRTGVFTYQMPDGSTRKEFRSDEVVFDAAALASIQMIPITDTHPAEFVTPENAKELAVGWTGENARRDGDKVRVPIKIATEDGIKAVEGGRRQLSLGYTCTLERKDGEFKGETYDWVQSKIRCNHLALCDEARAGAQATLRLDAGDAVMVTSASSKPTRKEKTKMPDTVKLRLDSTGLAYDVPPEVDAGYKALAKERTDVAEKLTAATAAMAELQGKHDGVTKELEDLKKVDNADAITKGVKARVELLAAVRPMLSEEDAKKADAMDDAALRIAAIKTMDKDFDAEKLDMADDVKAGYIKGRFDSAVSAFADSDEAKREDGKTVIGDGSGHKDAEDLADSRQKMQDRRDGKAEDKDKGKK